MSKELDENLKQEETYEYFNMHKDFSKLTHIAFMGSSGPAFGEDTPN